MNSRLGHVALLAVLLLAGCASVAPSAPAERGIAVTGSGRVSLPPDTAVLELGAEARAAQLADATAEVDRRMRAVLAQVKAAGVREADVRTAGYTIDPIAESRPPGDPGVRIVGYRVSNVVNVRTRDVAGVGRVVDAAVTPAPTSCATSTSLSRSPRVPRPRRARSPCRMRPRRRARSPRRPV
jgi:hypothetical protein